MKAKFFLCLRPPVIETDDGGYTKLPPIVASPYSSVSGKSSARRSRELQQRKSVAAEKYILQQPIKSKTNPFSGKISGPPGEKDSLKSQKACSPVSEANTPISFSGDKPVSFEKQSMISSGNVRGGPDLNPGVYLIVSSLFFTILLGKFFGILCTLTLICSVYPHRKNDHTVPPTSESMVVKSPERGSPEEYKKRVIMEGLLERKSHNRESIKCLS